MVIPGSLLKVQNEFIDRQGCHQGLKNITESKFSQQYRLNAHKIYRVSGHIQIHRNVNLNNSTEAVKTYLYNRRPWIAAAKIYFAHTLAFAFPPSHPFLSGNVLRTYWGIFEVFSLHRKAWRLTSLADCPHLFHSRSARFQITIEERGDGGPQQVQQQPDRGHDDDQGRWWCRCWTTWTSPSQSPAYGQALGRLEEHLPGRKAGQASAGSWAS